MPAPTGPVTSTTSLIQFVFGSMDPATVSKKTCWIEFIALSQYNTGLAKKTGSVPNPCGRIANEENVKIIIIILKNEIIIFIMLCISLAV